MKYPCRLLVTMCLVIGASSQVWAGGGTSANFMAPGSQPSRFDFRVIPFLNYQENEGLPPRLTLTVELACNQTVVQAVRSETIDPLSGKVTIVAGVLVEEDLLSTCISTVSDMTVGAGTTFSGREYEVVSVQ